MNQSACWEIPNELVVLVEVVLVEVVLVEVVLVEVQVAATAQILESNSLAITLRGDSFSMQSL